MPPCSKCPQPAVTHIPYSGQHLCREHFLHYFDKRAKAEVKQQGRIPPGTVAVALSGGKDSVSVLHFLHRLTRDRPDVTLAAISVDEGIEGYRGSALEICKEVCAEWGIEWHLVTTKELAGYTIDQYAAGTHGPTDPPGDTGQAKGPNGERARANDGRPRPACGPCGVFRRQGLNQVAMRIGADAVVTGHNLDDHAQTILMNHLNGDVDRIARLAPHSGRHDGMVPRLLPFRTIPEKEVLLYAMLHDLPLHHEAECPYAARAHRFRLRDMLWELEEATPGTRHSLVRGADRLKPLLLDAAVGGDGGTPCPTCGEPTSGAACKACSWRA